MVYAPNKRADQDEAFLAAEVGKLVDQTVKADSVLGRVATHHGTARPSVDFPLFVNPVSTGFTGELTDLPLSNAETASVNVPAYKVTGATQASSEMLADMDPSIAALLGRSISDSVIHTLDAAFLGNEGAVEGTTQVGFDGLQSLAYSEVDTEGEFTLDHVINAVFKAQALSSKPTALVVPPSTAEAISLMKRATDSAEYLTAFQSDGSISVAGTNVPLVVTNYVDAATTGWLVCQEDLRLVVREGTQVRKTYVPQNDSWFISGIGRYGFGSLKPASTVRIWDKTPA
ncbi:phage major capsid protein [Mycobacterium crocinum]|uniref:Phage major capsid protein n=1 Tax=Mycolicibacterium crocinum TaxID=388459 RepID=A0ABY3TUS4_9MYCO|nr:phage major capsid protein [Mycolicibacterium crocinum]MCV7217146.1 phage major capsid protein [Mycolicibacterium crocinum]ULN42890.1 phage major capsid protein [Mycolicibacterium crocinum]